MAREKDENLRGKGKESWGGSQNSWESAERNWLINGQKVKRSYEIPQTSPETK